MQVEPETCIDDETTEQLQREVAWALARRRGDLRRGYFRPAQAYLPRGLWALFEARGADNRKLLYPVALTLYLAYVRVAELAGRPGWRRVAGFTRAYFARCCGCTVRHVSRADKQLRALGLVEHGGWYVHTDEKGQAIDGMIPGTRKPKKRRVSWLPPLREVWIMRAVAALSDAADGDSGHPCPADLEEAPNGASSEVVSLSREQEAPTAPSGVAAGASTTEDCPSDTPTATMTHEPSTERPTAAPRGENATAEPAAATTPALTGEVFFTALRRFDGAELRALILTDLHRYGAERNEGRATRPARSAAPEKRRNPIDLISEAATGRLLRPVHEFCGHCAKCIAQAKRAEESAARERCRGGLLCRCRSCAPGKPHVGDCLCADCYAWSERRRRE